MQRFQGRVPHVSLPLRHRRRLRHSCWLAVSFGLWVFAACSPAPNPSLSPEPASPTVAQKDARVRVKRHGQEPQTETLLPDGRPPFPNMATDAWGKKVIAHRETQTETGLSELSYADAIERTMSHLHALEPGAESSAASMATIAWKNATKDDERSTALSLLAAALVLEPNIAHYKARLTDAHGLVMYAGTLLPETVLGQAARAFVAVAVGRVYEGKKFTDVLSGGPPLDSDAELFIALSRRFQAERNDVAFLSLRDVLQAKPESQRARAALAEGLLEMGLAASVLELTPETGFEQAPLLGALRGRALALAGNAKKGTELLRQATAQVTEMDRGKVLYWLGRTLAQQGRFQETDEVMQGLVGRPGYANEHAMLEALVAQMRGDYGLARKRAESVCSTRALSLPLALTCHWAIVDACAGLGDETCVTLWGKRAVGTDGDIARLQHARAALGIVGKSPNIDVDETLRKAHRLSPFDGELAKRVGEAVVPGGQELAGMMQGTRRALFFGAKNEVDRMLKPLQRNHPMCRVCRGLYARAAADIDESARRALRAFQGAGPELDEEDLLPLIDALGGSPISEGKTILERLARDKRPRIQNAAAQAIADLANPAARQNRKQREERSAADRAGESGHEHEAPAGSVPVPQLPPPGVTSGGQP